MKYGVCQYCLYFFFQRERTREPPTLINSRRGTPAVPKRTLLCYIKAGLYVVGYTGCCFFTPEPHALTRNPQRSFFASGNPSLVRTREPRGAQKLPRKPPISTIHQGVAAPVASLITYRAFCAFPRIDDCSVCRGETREPQTLTLFTFGNPCRIARRLPPRGKLSPPGSHVRAARVRGVRA